MSTSQALKAELKIQETQAKDAKLNLPVQVDTRNGIVPGHIIRIAPSSQDGTVTMDVQLDDPLPDGARPGLTVDGTIQIDHADNVMFVNRPTFGQKLVEVFKVVENGQAVIRVPVQLSRTSRADADRGPERPQRRVRDRYRPTCSNTTVPISGALKSKIRRPRGAEGQKNPGGSR